MNKKVPGSGRKKTSKLPPAKTRHRRARAGEGSFGLVGYCVHGKSKAEAAPNPLSPAQLIQAVQGGLPLAELEALQESLAVPMARLVPKLGISKSTLHRRKAQGRLDPAESDRVLRFARLMGKAVEVLESEENARRWLDSPQVGLGGAVPLDFAVTEIGAREVEDLLGRIDYGVYS